MSLNTQANLKNFYNKVPFLKEINNKRRPRPSSRNVSNEKRDGFGKIEDDEEKEKIELNPMEHILRFVMGLHNVSGTYARNEGPCCLDSINVRRTQALIKTSLRLDCHSWWATSTQTCTEMDLVTGSSPSKPRPMVGLFSSPI